MQDFSHNKLGTFSDRKVSIIQAMKILKKNGIETNEEQAEEILNFLYLLAKVQSVRSSQDTSVYNIQEGGIEH